MLTFNCVFVFAVCFIIVYSVLFGYLISLEVLSSDELVILLILSLRRSQRVAVMPAALPYHELKVI